MFESLFRKSGSLLWVWVSFLRLGLFFWVGSLSPPPSTHGHRLATNHRINTAQPNQKEESSQTWELFDIEDDDFQKQRCFLRLIFTKLNSNFTSKTITWPNEVHLVIRQSITKPHGN